MLTISDIKEILASNENRDILAKAKKNEERLRFHSVTELDSNQQSNVLNNFLSYIDNIYYSELRSEQFRTFFRFPIPTNSLTESIFTDLKKVFDGQNAVQEYKFKDSTLAEDWNRYSKEVLKEHQRWIGEGFNRFKYHINSFIVVDMPSEQTSDKPEPYYYWLKVDNVISFRVKDDTDVLEYIAFHKDEHHFVVIDDRFYRVCEYDRDITKFVVVSENTHDLGYCPVCFFWSDFLGVNKCLKESPLSKELDNLDYYLFKVINLRIAELGAEYPVWWKYREQQGCTYENPNTGVHCSDGFLLDKNNQQVLNADGSVQKCPRCGTSQFRGAGSLIEIDYPEGEDKLIGVPAGVVVTPTDSLKYIADNCERHRQYIYNSVVGYDGYDSGTAMNELQIKSKFENRRTVLNRLKTNFENAQYFVEDTICRLRYGKDYLGCVIDYGTEFYIYTIEELRARYKEAKLSGSSEVELDYLADQIMFTENKTNPVNLERMQILKNIEPYRHMSSMEVINMYQSGLIDETMAKIKINFSGFIDRFERENMNILEFGNGISFYEKIDRIINALKTYANEQRGRQQENQLQ